MEEDIIIGIDPGTNLLGYGILSCKGKQPVILAMGVIDMRKCKDTHEKLGRIYERVKMLIEQFHPREMAIEAPFYGKNVQSMLKLGRAQGVAIAAAIGSDIKVSEYAPKKIKMAITGQGEASKEQVSAMLQHIFGLNNEAMLPYMDATDAIGAAYCHFLQRGRMSSSKSYSNWSDYVSKNSSRVSMPKRTNTK